MPEFFDVGASSDDIEFCLRRDAAELDITDLLRIRQVAVLKVLLQNGTTTLLGVGALSRIFGNVLCSARNCTSETAYVDGLELAGS